MMKRGEYILPKWTPRVRKERIRRLYQAVGRGIIDEEMINDVGFSLLARCISILEATEASRGKAKCPICESLVLHKCQKEEILTCQHCGWICTWQEYKKTYQHKQLSAGGMEPFFIEFVRDFSVTRSTCQRLVLIDVLLHRYHWENTERPSRPGATNLIEGRMGNIMDFLDHLTYGDSIPQEIETTRAEWRQKVKRARRVWGGQ